MMERLRGQHDASDPLVAQAAKLLVDLAPAADEPGQKERVRESLARRLGERRRRAPAWVLVPATGFLVVAAFAAERMWNPPAEAPVLERPIVREEPAELAPPKTEPVLPSAARELDRETVAPAPGRPDPKPDPKRKLEPKRSPTQLAVAVEATPSTVEVTAPPERARDDEALLLVEAIRTLRREHRPEAAVALLDEYLRRYPGGALHEEGLALAVEAASASKDDLRTAERAREYIANYPNGRFRALADAARSARSASSAH